MDMVTVYQAWEIPFPIEIVVPAVLLILLGIWRFYLQKRQGEHRPALLYCLIIGMVFCVMAVGLLGVNYLSDTARKAGISENPTYREIEGTVENFIPQYTKQAQDEVFTVNGVTFKTNGKDRIGYDKVYSLGGYIRYTGQWVKLAYVQDGENFIILKLTVLEQDLVLPQE